MVQNRVDLHEGPSRASPVIGVLRAGTRVHGVDQAGAWLRVRSDAADGYVPQDAVSAVASPEEHPELRPEAAADPDRLLFQLGLGGGYAPESAVALLTGRAAYRFLWPARYLAARLDYTLGFAGTMLNQLGRIGAEMGAELGDSGFYGAGGLGFRVASLAVLYQDNRVFYGPSLFGCLYTDPRPNVRVELGLELDYPAGGPGDAEGIVGLGSHAQANWKIGEIVFFTRFELLDFHSKTTKNSRDDLSTALSIGLAFAR
jgi:hypothetical protein